MGNIFAGSEIIEIGIQIEENGRDFYNALVEKSKDEKTKELFQLLASEEEKHIAAFGKVLDSVQKYEPPEAYPGEYFAYMNALASQHVFTQENKGAEIARKIAADKEAVELGIKFEMDSIVFYEGMKKVVPEYDQKVVEELIKQEQTHLVKLTAIKNNL